MVDKGAKEDKRFKLEYSVNTHIERRTKLPAMEEEYSDI